VGRAATIAGAVVEPIKPVTPRPIYNHTGETASGRSALGYAGSGVGGKTGYNPWANSPGTQRSNGWTMPNRPSAGGTYRTPIAPPYAGGAYRAPSTRPYAGAGGTYHVPSASPYSGGSRPSAPAPAPRSGGGGGAPAAHVSSGGGGGGHPAASPHK